MSLKRLVWLSVVLALLVLIPTFFVKGEELEHYGSWISGGGSILAVLWFSSSLKTQSDQLTEQRIQLTEQRVQFAAQFHHQQQASRREALLFAQGILEKGLASALQRAGVGQMTDLPNAYGQAAKLMAPLMLEPDPLKVQDFVNNWLPAELAVSEVVKSIKTAAEIYFTSMDVKGIDYTLEPEEFVLTYVHQLNKLPFFDNFIGLGQLIAAMLSTYAPGRKAVMLAFMAASAMALGKGLVKTSNLDGLIEKHNADGHPVPKIVQLYTELKLPRG